MKRTAENIVSSYFFYIWNAWCEEECKTVYQGEYRHFWKKWCGLSDKAIFGAAERFYAELSDNNRELLVNRAVAVFDGNARKRELEDSEILVCAECGAMDIECQAWIDANTDEFISDVENDSDGHWCCDCQDHLDFDTFESFKEKLQAWWSQTDFATMERITGLKEADFPFKDGSQAFLDASNAWWQNQDYEQKREVYRKYKLDAEYDENK